MLTVPSSEPGSDSEFSNLSPHLDSASSASFDAIDAAASASMARMQREPSPYNVGGYGLHSTVSPSKNCDAEARQLLTARFQKAAASKSQHSHATTLTPSSSAAESRWTTPAPDSAMSLMRNAL